MGEEALGSIFLHAFNIVCACKMILLVYSGLRAGS